MNPSAFSLRQALLFFSFFIVIGFIINPLYSQIPNPEKPDTAYRMGLLARYYRLPSRLPQQSGRLQRDKPFACRIWPRLHSDTGGKKSGLDSKGPFLLQLSGEWFVPRAGTYRLKPESSGKAIFWIDGKRIFDSESGRRQAGKPFVVQAEAGPHTLKVRFFASEGDKSRTLSLSWDYETPGKFVPVAEEFFRVKRKTEREAAAELSPGYPNHLIEEKAGSPKNNRIRSRTLRPQPAAATANEKFQPKAIRAFANGFEIEFSEPLSAGLNLSKSIKVSEQLIRPGGDISDSLATAAVLIPAAFRMGKNKRHVLLEIKGLKAGYDYCFQFGQAFLSQSGRRLEKKSACCPLRQIPADRIQPHPNP